jgi:thiol-disulfide isomerase/thioredoxin
MTTEASRPLRGRLAALVGAFALAQLGAVALYRWVERERGDPPRFRVERVDASAQPLAMLRADGTPLTLESLRGRPVLLHFWATWCVPCRVEIPALLALADDSRGDLTIVAVALDDDPIAVRSFFNGRIPPPVALARAADAERAYGVSALPDSYLLDAEGNPRFRMRGPRDWGGPAVRTALRELDPRLSITRTSD